MVSLSSLGGTICGDYMKDEPKVAVLTSGFFDPLHSGHLDCFFEAATYGDLFVIINNDEQAVQKKGGAFLPARERRRLIAALRCVEGTFISESTDETVCIDIPNIANQLRKKYNRILFVKGGDRKVNNTPELQVCEDNKIPILWGIGGEKTESSSDFLQRWVDLKGK